MATEISADTLAKIAEAVATATAKATFEHDAKLRPTEVALSLGRSVFNPRAGEPGYKKPTLTRQTFFCAHEEKDTELSPEEITLYNQILTPGRYHNRRWEVIIPNVEETGGKPVLDIRIPCKEMNDRLEMPTSLTAILREIIAEAATKTPAKK